MAKLGRYNILKVVKEVDFGLYLDGGRDGEILLPTRYVPEGTAPGDRLEVFVYLDSEDRLIATTERPLAQADEFAHLQVVAVGGAGAFLDWGLPKDLLVPYREQAVKMREGQRHLVFVHEDRLTRRIVASARVERFVDKSFPDLEIGEKVDLLIGPATELGFKAIVNNRYWGLVFANEVFAPIETGQRTVGYVKQVRDDGKIDLRLQPLGFAKVEGATSVILQRLQEAGGYLAVTDKSPAELISSLFGISKKTYKQAVGDLYKRRVVLIEPEGIRLATED